MPAPVRTSSLSRPSAQMLFLASHGLQTPLSAIRWGCSRLRKERGGKLTPGHLRLIEGIQDQAKVLAHMINALLLLAKVEEGVYLPRMQQVYLRDFLLSYPPVQELFAGARGRVSCPSGLVLRIDRGILEFLLQSIAVILATAGERASPARIRVTSSEEYVISFHPPIELSLLRDVTDAALGKETWQLVGGVPGLMLSVASSLASFLGGSIQVKPQARQRYSLQLRLPLSVSASSSGGRRRALRTAA